MTAISLKPLVTTKNVSNKLIGTFSDTKPLPANKYIVSISWGDSFSSQAVIAKTGENAYNIVASHTYHKTGKLTLKVTVYNTITKETSNSVTSITVGSSGGPGPGPGPGKMKHMKGGPGPGKHMKGGPGMHHKKMHKKKKSHMKKHMKHMKHKKSHMKHMKHKKSHMGGGMMGGMGGMGMMMHHKNMMKHMMMMKMMSSGSGSLGSASTGSPSPSPSPSPTPSPTSSPSPSPSPSPTSSPSPSPSPCPNDLTRPSPGDPCTCASAYIINGPVFGAPLTGEQCVNPCPPGYTDPPSFGQHCLPGS